MNFKTPSLIKLLFVGLVLINFTSCKKDSNSDSSDGSAITLEAQAIAGKGQYTVSHELAPNSQPLNIKVSITPANDIKSFTITKSINVDSIDKTYGTDGILTVNTAEVSSGEYMFTYSPKAEDAYKLVGFKFTVEKNNGAKSVSDLTLNVSFTPAGNLPYRKWQLKSIVYVNGDPANEDITEDCNKDDYLSMNTDGSCVYDYGALSCNIFEPFDTPQTWTLSADNSTYTLNRLSGFTGAITPQVYVVKELTLTSFKIELTVDMTGLGGGPNDTFLYTYAATPK